MVSGDFTAEVKISGQYAALYDQAGLMVRLDEIVWLKCGIELLDGVQQVSAVVTRDFSDWSVIALPHNPPSIWIRLLRRGDTIEIYYSLDGMAYTLFRQTHLTPAPAVSVGLMACSPTGKGFPVTFEGFAVQEG
jgi:regulation of enolase protein 1 (concanavalin A-like superfamily)